MSRTRSSLDRGNCRSDRGGAFKQAGGLSCLGHWKSLTRHRIPDLHEYMGGPNLCPTTPHPITGETVPLTFGHEFSAIVTEVGEGVKDFKEGDRVAVEVCIS